MKKILFIICLLLIPTLANASNANITIDSSKNNPSKNDIVTITVTVSSSTPIRSYEYTLDYDHADLELIKGNSFNTFAAEDDETTKMQNRFDFKIKNATKSSISVKSYSVIEHGSSKQMDVKVYPFTFGKSTEISISKNNDLSFLEVPGYSLSPKFDKDITSYTVTILDNIKEIDVKATAFDRNATVSGNTKYRLSKGSNKIEIKVRSESGDVKTYSITIVLKEKDPITVKINEKEYTVVKELSKSKYNDYIIKKIKIDNIETDSLYNEKSDITLVAMEDSNGKIKYFRYDIKENYYYDYIELKDEDITLVPLNFNGNIKDYTVFEENIYNTPVKCFKASRDEKTCIIYGVNLKTGEKDFYQYDLETNKINKYEIKKDDVIKTKEISDKTLYNYIAIIGLGLIILLVLINKYNHKKRRYKRRKKISRK